MRFARSLHIVFSNRSVHVVLQNSRFKPEIPTVTNMYICIYYNMYIFIFFVCSVTIIIRRRFSRDFLRTYPYNISQRLETGGGHHCSHDDDGDRIIYYNSFCDIGDRTHRLRVDPVLLYYGGGTYSVVYARLTYMRTQIKRRTV